MRSKLLVVLAILVASCTNKVEIPGLDLEKWQQAANCSEYRITGAEVLIQNEAKLIGLTQVDLAALLGSAPRHQLGSRSEKFYFYPISEGCDSLESKALQFRFDALGRAKEVMIVLTDQ